MSKVLVLRERAIPYGIVGEKLLESVNPIVHHAIEMISNHPVVLRCANCGAPRECARSEPCRYCGALERE